LGDGYGSDRIVPRPLDILITTTSFQYLTVGGDHGCGILRTGALYCWGAGASGALGTGRNGNERSPIAVSLLSSPSHPVLRAAAGRYHSCAVTTASELYCWGYSGNGQLGTGHIDEDNTPPTILSPERVNIQGASDDEIISLATGAYHSCAIFKNGRAFCWGQGAFGQLGNGCEFGADDTSSNPCARDRPLPIELPYFDRVSGARHAVAIAAGEYHSCARTINGSLFCFGRGNDGQLGINDRFSYSQPQHVGNITAEIVAIAAGNNHTCALLVNGKVYCFGDNAYGQIGNGSHRDSVIPVAVDFSRYEEPEMIGIAAGGDHSCSWDREHNYYCWGKNESGQLGGGFHSRSEARPLRAVQLP